MGARCNQCGNCCERIPLNTTKTALRKQKPETEKGRANRSFVLAHWTWVGRWGKQQVYSCDAFDPVTRQCTAHDERPPICREYPWYGRSPNKEQLMAEPEKLGSCSYWFDIPKKEWPDGIAPYRLGGTPVAIRTRIA